VTYHDKLLIDKVYWHLTDAEGLFILTTLNMKLVFLLLTVLQF